MAKISPTTRRRPRETTGDRIARLRLAHEWTQQDLAARTGLSVHTISRAERGHEIYAYTLDGMAAAFGISMDVLWRGEP